MELVKCFSVLVASGNGQRCNQLKKVLRENLFEVEDGTDKFRLTIWKYGKESMPEAHKKIALEMSREVKPLFGDIDHSFWSVDYQSKVRRG